MTKFFDKKNSLHTKAVFLGYCYYLLFIAAVCSAGLGLPQWPQKLRAESVPQDGHVQALIVGLILPHLGQFPKRFTAPHEHVQVPATCTL